MTYDARCFEFAKVWLVEAGNHSDVAADQLAKELQLTIEQFIEDLDRFVRPS